MNNLFKQALYIGSLCVLLSACGGSDIEETSDDLLPPPPAPVDPNPVDPNPVDPNPVDPNPVDPNPVDPNPVDPNPVDPNPVDPNPVDPNPVDPNPTDCADQAMNRTRYLEPTAQTCQSEIQTRSCVEGEPGDWSGTYLYSSCADDLPDNANLPLLEISDVVFKGGFRLSSDKHGDNDLSTLNWSPGAIAFNPENNSLFVVSHDYEQSIGEFVIPEVVDSRDMNDYLLGEQVLQNFAEFHDVGRVDTGISSNFRITGMAQIDNQLVVNYINWYDGGGQETDTSVVFKNASNLATSDVTGPFQIQGAAHAAGWLTPIPDEWKADLEGTFIAGHSHGSILSRLSVGPPAFIVNPETTLLSDEVVNGPVSSEAVLDFDLNNMLYDVSIYGDSYSDSDPILYNHNLQNDLWTVDSGVSYGFIIPGTNTYMTVGKSAGHESGLGYKIVQNNGRLCGGACPYDHEDMYNYLWLWRVTDFIKVKNGELAAHDVRPYQYGELDTPSSAPLYGAAYDEENNRLYVSLRQGDTTATFRRPPIFYVFDISVD